MPCEKLIFRNGHPVHDDDRRNGHPVHDDDRRNPTNGHPVHDDDRIIFVAMTSIYEVFYIVNFNFVSVKERWI